MRLPRWLSSSLAPYVLTSLAACGAQSVSPSDVDGGAHFADHVTTVLPDAVDATPDRFVPPDVPQDTAPFATAAHPAFPQVVSNGGPTIASVQLVQISFATYDYTADVEALGRWVVGSDWLTTVGRDYGVGAGVYVRHVVLTTPPPLVTTDDAVRTLIANGIAAGTLPAVTPETLYMIYYPRTSTIEGPDGVGTSCVAYGGYHDRALDRTPAFTYAVIPSCPDTGSDLSELQYIQLASAHELIEAASDADPLGMAGWQLMDQTSPWTFVGGEIGDLCESETIMDSGFTVQRIWSNTAAAMGNVDPCIPAAPGEVYFNAAPTPDTVAEVMPGQTVTLTVTGFSSAPTADWFITAAPSGGGMFVAEASLDRARINNGGTATLTVRIPPDASPGSYGGVILVSSRTADLTDLSQAHIWPVFFVVP